MALRSDNPVIQIGADFAGAKASRFRRNRSVPGQGASADYHYRSEGDYLRLLEYARDMDRNDAVIPSLFDRAADNIVGEGIECDPQTGVQALDKAIAPLWRDWSEDSDQCDAAGERTMHELTWLTCRQHLVDGDIFALMVDGISRDDPHSVNLVESHRCRAPAHNSKHGKRSIVLGIELDERRRRVAAWFTKDEIDPQRAITRLNAFEPEDFRDRDTGLRKIAHVYNSKRATQTRGVTALAPCFEVAGMFEDLHFAKLVQAQVVSCIAILESTQSGSSYSGGPPQIGAQTTDLRSDGTTRTQEAMAPGKWYRAPEGKKIEGFSPNVPNAEFFPHVRQILQLISINVGIPLVLLMLDGSETNFSGWRGALDEAKKGFRRNQRMIVRRFLQPVYDWKVAEWIAGSPALQTLAAQAGPKRYNAVWSPPTWPYIEPLRDASADLLRESNCQISPRRLHAERGRRWDAISEETIEDRGGAITKAIQKAQQIEQQTGEKVHWRDLLPLSSAQGIKLTLADLEAPEPPAPKAPAASDDNPPAKEAA